MSVRMCPVCGSTTLMAKALFLVSQDPEGTWDLMATNSEDITLAMDDPNNEVFCGNEFCGDPMDGLTGQKVELKENESLLEYWRRVYLPTLEETPSPAEEEAYFKSWLDEVYYTPWSGVLAACPSLDEF